MNYDMRVARKYIDEVNGHRMLDLELSCTRAPGDSVVDVWMTFDMDGDVN